MIKELLRIWQDVLPILRRDLKQIFTIHLAYVALARDLLAEQAKLTSLERLLIHTAVLLDQPIPSKTYRDQSP